MIDGTPPVAAPPRENVVGIRIVAALIDVAILIAIFIVMSIAFGGVESESGDGETSGSVNLTGWPFALYLVIVLGYYAAFELLTQRTPGKMIMGLRVESADEEPLTPARIIVRNLLRIIDGLPFLYVVGLVTIAASKRNQHVGDMAGRTVVVRAR